MYRYIDKIWPGASPSPHQKLRMICITVFKNRLKFSQNDLQMV